MAATDHLQIAYSFLFDPEDARFASDERLEWALSVAAHMRPLCLPVELQDLAQAHYAAYLLSAQLVAPAVFGTVSSSAAQNVAGPIIERQEGQVRTRYANGGSGSSSSSTTRSGGGGDPGPSAPYAAWASLAAMCGPVPGLDPTASAEKTRGGIIVRSNPVVVSP